jgi:predicted HD superfamily hydrolase involved in NAD metabolism
MAEEKYDIQAMNKTLRKYMDKGRFIHTQGVRYTSTALAMAHGIDLEKAEVAGLLHDCAKCIPNDKKIRMCKEHGIEISKVELDAPYLLHSKLGAYLAKEKYGVKDPEIISAIKWHTTGRPNMTTLEKIIFTADYIEPGRVIPNALHSLDEIRSKVMQDLDKTLVYVIENTIDYLKKTGRTIDEASLATLSYYEKTID